MEGVAGISAGVVLCVLIVLAILLLLMPVFVFQISNSAERIEKAIKEFSSSTARTEATTNQILAELQKTNTHFIPPPEQ
jgi:predicted PurR-regulated permease PerM